MVISLNVQYNGGFLPYILLLNQAAIIVVWFDGIIIIVDYFITTYRLLFLKKNQNAPRPSEHPPVRGKKCQSV